MRGGPVAAAVRELPAESRAQLVDHVPAEWGERQDCWAAVHLEGPVDPLLQWQRHGPAAHRHGSHHHSRCYHRSVLHKYHFNLDENTR